MARRIDRYGSLEGNHQPFVSYVCNCHMPAQFFAFDLEAPLAVSCPVTPRVRIQSMQPCG